MQLHISTYARLLFLPLILMLALTGCEKDEEIIIAGNVPPPDQTVEDFTIENYINRVYVTVLSREPDSSERSFAFNILRQNNLSTESRMQILDSVFADPAYRPHLYDNARIELLNNLDTAQISFYLFVLNFYLSDTTYQLYWPTFQYEIVRLDSMLLIPADLVNGQLDIAHLHRRCVNNYFYDQINMGTENFVVSCFQHFLNRYPTTFELDEGKKMVDGTPAILFLESGQSKADFLQIFFTSNDYFEGLCVNLYLKFLLRSPTSTEMGNATQKFLQQHDYEEMQKDILATNEYMGIE